MTSSDSEERPPPRKRTKRSTSSEDAGSKKTRGRPRVDTEDASATERRRTQIRLAQRAYRQRKETTISSLKEQNTQLQNIIERMNTSFQRFDESALHAGIRQWNPRLAQELKHLANTFIALTKDAASDGSSEHDHSPETTLDAAAELHDAAAAARSSQDSSPTAAQQPAVSSETNMDWASSTSFLKEYTNRPVPSPLLGTSLFNIARFPFPRNSGVADSRNSLTAGQAFDSPGTLSDTSSEWPQLPFGLIDLPSDSDAAQEDPVSFSVNIPTPAVTPPMTRLSTPPLAPSLTLKTLTPSWTYSYEETTFARRLTRAALEAAFHILSETNPRQAILNYVFKLSLSYMSVDQLRERFKMLLTRGVEEDLDIPGPHLVNFGGAGTHFPRRNAKLSGDRNRRKLGPRRPGFESITASLQGHLPKVDLAGFEGEWFDPHDVQGYLEEEKGCYIDPKDSFAEVMIYVDEDTGMSELDDLLLPKDFNLGMDSLNGPKLSQDSPSLTSGSTTESMSNTGTPPGNLETLFGSGETFGLDMGSPDLGFMKHITGMDVSAMMDQPLDFHLSPVSDASANFMTAQTPSTGDFDFGSNTVESEMQLPVVKQKRKKMAWVDVSKLIDELLKRSICLGRTPGIRRTDVDVAFEASIISAF